MTAAFKILYQNTFYHKNYIASQANIFSSMLILLNAESQTLPCKKPDSFALHLKATLYKNTPEFNHWHIRFEKTLYIFLKIGCYFIRP